MEDWSSNPICRKLDLLSELVNLSYKGLLIKVPICSTLSFYGLLFIFTLSSFDTSFFLYPERPQRGFSSTISSASDYNYHSVSHISEICRSCNMYTYQDLHIPRKAIGCCSILNIDWQQVILSLGLTTGFAASCQPATRPNLRRIRLFRNFLNRYQET